MGSLANHGKERQMILPKGGKEVTFKIVFMQELLSRE